MDITAHLRYYDTLEADFVAATRYVELDERNLGTFSIEFVRLLVSICAEVEITSKLLCQHFEPEFKSRFFPPLVKKLDELVPGLKTLKLKATPLKEPLKPWDDISEADGRGSVPKWWTAYNKIKHSRHISYDYANLGNVVHSLAGLYCILMYLSYLEVGKDSPNIPSKVFQHDYYHPHRHLTTRKIGWILPEPPNI